jgi:hypothetical protein
MRRLDSQILRELLGSDGSNSNHLTSGPVIGMELIGKDVI